MNERVQIWMSREDFMRLKEHITEMETEGTPLENLAIAVVGAYCNNSNWPIEEE